MRAVHHGTKRRRPGVGTLAETLDHLRGPKMGQFVLRPAEELDGELWLSEEWWAYPYFDTEEEAIEEATKMPGPVFVAKVIPVEGGWTMDIPYGPW